MKIARPDAIEHSRNGVLARYYQLPTINGGTTVAYAEFTGEHGQRTTGEWARIYYILEGEATFSINGEMFDTAAGDVVAIPPKATYNLWPKGDVVKVLLVMELLDISQLPR